MENQFDITKDTPSKSWSEEHWLLALMAAILLAAALFFFFYKKKGAEAKAAVVDETAAEVAEEQAFYNRGYDQGYLNAVWDTYLGEPLYMVQENTNEDGAMEITLWKKQDIDPYNMERINSHGGGGETGETALPAEEKLKDPNWVKEGEDAEEKVNLEKMSP